MGTSFAAVIYRPSEVSERALSHGFGVATAGFDVPKASVRMPHGPIKHTGEQTLSVALHTDVAVEIQVVVVGDVD